MSSFLSIVAQTLVEHSLGRKDSEIAAACDATVEFLKRQRLLPRERRQFVLAVKRELRAQDRTASVTMVTPSETSPERKKSLMASLKTALGADVDLREEIDPRLIGGARLSWGDERFDASLRGAMDQLSTHLSA